MSDASAQQSAGLDLWLAYQQHKLVIDVVGVLEVEAGLRLATRTHPIFELTGFHDRVQALILDLDAVSNLARALASDLGGALRSALWRPSRPQLCSHQQLRPSRRARSRSRPRQRPRTG